MTLRDDALAAMQRLEDGTVPRWFARGAKPSTDDDLAVVRKALESIPVEFVPVQCPECSGMGERYYRHADAILECLRCIGEGTVPEEDNR